MIEDIRTGRLIATDIRPIEVSDLRALGLGWRFDSRASVESMEVFKLIDPVAPDTILGLLGLKRCENYIEVGLLESHPHHVGRAKSFRGIPGNLLAFAAQLSFQLGGEGFITIDAKNELIEHYRQVYGFMRVGNSQRMILTTGPAANLIRMYRGEASP